MINWDRVEELRDEIGPEDFGEVVELFLDEVEEVIARLQTAPDPGMLAADLHFLKGSALNLGFHAFSMLCQAGEVAAASGKADTVDLARVIQSFFDSKADFQKHLAAA